MVEEGGYAHERSTKPATLGAALCDSPAGLAAWIGEKIIAWSSTRPDGAPAFDRELPLATLTLYWVTGTITSSLLPIGRTATALTPYCRPMTPVSLDCGRHLWRRARPFPKPPRELAQRYYTVTDWAEHAVGGHFPAGAEPELSLGSCAARSASRGRPRIRAWQGAPNSRWEARCPAKAGARLAIAPPSRRCRPSPRGSTRRPRRARPRSRTSHEP